MATTLTPTAAVKVLYFGVSNHYPSQMRLLQSRLDVYDMKLVTNEVEISVWNPSHLAYNDGTVDFLYRNKVRPSKVSDKPCLSSFLYMQVRPVAWSALAGDPQGGLNRLFQRHGTRQFKIRKALRDVGSGTLTINCITCSQVGDQLGGYEEDVVALAWLLRHPSGMIPLIGTTDLQRIQSQAQAVDLYEQISESQWWQIGKEGGLCAFAEDQCDYDEYKP
jgi:predicted oxidoreductase